MLSIIVDNEPIEISPPPREVFANFAQLVHMRLPTLQDLPEEKRYIGQLPAGYLLTRRVEDPTFAEPLTQAALQNLHDLGVREVTLHPENGTAMVRRSEHTDCSLGRPSWLAKSTVESGRAYIAALNCVLHRKFQLNDHQVLVGIQPVESLKEARAALGSEKGENESMLFATARMLGSLLQRKMGFDTTEMRCMIELASGMGLSAISIDLAKNEILFRGFSEMSALSTALLQGANWKSIEEIRRQIRNMAAQSVQGGGAGSGTMGYNPASIKRRRRK